MQSSARERRRRRKEVDTTLTSSVGEWAMFTVYCPDILLRNSVCARHFRHSNRVCHAMLYISAAYAVLRCSSICLSVLECFIMFYSFYILNPAPGCYTSINSMYVCLSVRVSVAFVFSVETSKHILKNFSPSGGHTT